MRRQQLVRSVVVVLLCTGCESKHMTFAGAESPAVLLAQAEATATPVSRSQKPDPEAGAPIRRTVFDAAREPFPDLGDNRATVRVRIRAHVNGVPIFDEEVRDACYPSLVTTMNLPEPERSSKQNEIFRGELQQIIDREVILQDAFAKLSKNGGPYLDKLKTAAAKEFDRVMRTMKTRAGTKTDEELKNFLAAQGLSLEGMRRQVERNFMAREYMRSRIFPVVERIGRQQLLEYYQDHDAEFQRVDSVKWQDIFIDAGKFKNREEARRFAEQLVQRARAGEDFAKLAAQFDNGDSVYRNGEGYGSHRGEIKPGEAEPILFQMKEGEVGPPVELPSGFHVVRLVKREQAGRIPFDDKTQAEVRRKLQSLVAEQESKKLVAELKQKASIEVASGTP